ncbi:unnamed protein product [Microthlaspi erraticum]|uniref:CCHC-type domain-containing protein n=1 Tax=Microthlaspi erraticum TaxID=1685480 RepID=A0A6D2L1D9_9BRAS|nr:unnamed protein product [Microthlaspi erraticum]
MDSFLKLIADLESLDIKISDEDQAIQVLSGLPQAYEPLLDTLKYGMGKDTITLRDVTASAYAKEVELRQKGLLNKSKSNPEGLYVEASRGRSEKREDYKGNNRGKSKSGKNSRSKSRSKFGNKACWICGSENHWKRDCPEKKKNDSKNNSKASSNIAVNLPEASAYTVSMHNPKDEWVLDSGCTFHITPRKDMLFDLQEFEGNRVMMANDTHYMVKGIGKLTIENPHGTLVTLNNVRYMPEMGRNLIPYGQLEQAGCIYQGKDFEVQFYKDDKRVLTGKFDQGL